MFCTLKLVKTVCKPRFHHQKNAVCTLHRANFDAVTLSLVLVDHPRRALRSVGGLKHVTRRHFAWLRWPNEAEAGPEILRAYRGPSRLCVGQFVPHTDYTWPIWWGGLEACWATMVLCSLPGPDVIFEWSSTWPRGLVGSPRHCPRASMPIF